MKKAPKLLLKILSYCVVAVVLFYALFWFFLYLSHSFPSYFTVYSKDFNEESFQKINIGEDKKMVDSILGKPLWESVSNENLDSIKDIYWYTEARYGSSYDKIFILFYEDKVSEKIRVIDMD